MNGNRGFNERLEIAGPVRSCVICRRRFARDSLARHIVDGTGNLISDEKKTMPGRGWYCCDSPACVKRFAKFKPGRRHKKSGQTAGN